MTESDRAAGALLGLAVGDALGATTEFERPTGLPSYPHLVAGPLTEIAGGGPHRVARGQITDDTQMACCLADALRTCGRATTVDEIASRYVAWRPYAFDIGILTRQTLDLVAAGMPAEDAGRTVWVQRQMQPAGNGSLMRTAPLGVCFARDPSRRISMSVIDSSITHFDPRCMLACVAFNGAIAAAVRGETARDRMTTAAADDLQIAVPYLANEVMSGYASLVSEAHQLLLADLHAAMAPDPGVDRAGTHLYDDAGYVRVAFRLAFWHLLHDTSFEAAIIDVANRGGDADTNAAIVGALLGARFGQGAIPKGWKEAVLGAIPAQGEDSPLATIYHPLALVSGADALLRAGAPPA